jgi:nucleotide-binding universal stress UspA family protein
MDINRILVPVSFAPSCKKAIRTAATLASAFEAKLFVVSVYKTPPRMFHNVGGIQYTKAMDTERETWVKDLDRMLQREIKTLKLSELEFEEVHIEDKDPVKAILKVARDREVDMIVVGHHEESALERLLFGRNISKLVEGAECDVIVTRSQIYRKTAQKAA